MIGGVIRIDLSEVDDSFYQLQRSDRHRLDVLSLVPDGVRVIVDIGDRRHVTQDAAVWLHEHDHRLEIEIHGTDPKAVADFIRAGRSGEWLFA